MHQLLEVHAVLAAAHDLHPRLGRQGGHHLIGRLARNRDQGRMAVIQKAAVQGQAAERSRHHPQGVGALAITHGEFRVVAADGVGADHDGVAERALAMEPAAQFIAIEVEQVLAGGAGPQGQLPVDGQFGQGGDRNHVCLDASGDPLIPVNASQRPGRRLGRKKSGAALALILPGHGSQAGVRRFPRAATAGSHPCGPRISRAQREERTCV